MVARQVPRSTAKEQAVYWVTRLHSGECTETERRAFEAWLAAHDSHRHEYELARRFWDSLGSAQAVGSPHMDAARAYRPSRAFSRGAAVAAAVALVAISAGIGLLAPWGGGETYRTAKGESRTIELADGSQILMNTDTELSVNETRRSRTITLNFGEALFTVAHNGDPRPFEVHTRSGRVRDLGTEFAVDARGDAAAVTVVEGLVEVSTNADGGRPPQRLSMGERLTFSAGGDLSEVEQVDAHAATAWREGRWVFKGVPLDEIAAQIARYHDVDIRVGDVELARLKLSGTFRIHDLDGLLAAIEATLPVKAMTAGGDRRVVRLDRIHRLPVD
jgi:transmembrane sensor